MADGVETKQHAIETILLEERRYSPPEDFASQANAQADIYDRDFDEFWETEARERVTWFEPFDKLLEWETPYAKWYLGGKLNICFNCFRSEAARDRDDPARGAALFTAGGLCLPGERSSGYLRPGLR